jgi:hypothetical protein
LRIELRQEPKTPRKEPEKIKYILMMNATKSDFEQYARWSKKDLQANVAFMRSFTKELKDAGVFVSSEGLSWPHEARLVRAGSQGEPVTDGVFPESKEFLAGYWIIDVEEPEQAYRIAARLSQGGGTKGGPGMSVEVRQVLSGHSDLGL